MPRPGKFAAMGLGPLHPLRPRLWDLVPALSRKHYNSDTPRHQCAGVPPSSMRLASQSRNRKVVARMSRSVRTLASTCSRVPHGTGETELHPLKETIRPLGESALPCEILRWLFHCFLANTVVFLPLALRQRTHRNAIQLSRYSRPILSEIHKSGNGRMSLYLFIHPRHEWTGLSKKDGCKCNTHSYARSHSIRLTHSHLCQPSMYS